MTKGCRGSMPADHGDRGRMGRRRRYPPEVQISKGRAERAGQFHERHDRGHGRGRRCARGARDGGTHRSSHDRCHPDRGRRGPDRPHRREGAVVGGRDRRGGRRRPRHRPGADRAWRSRRSGWRCGSAPPGARQPEILALSLGIAFNVLVRAELGEPFGLTAVVTGVVAALLFVAGVHPRSKLVRAVTWIGAGCLVAFAVAATAGFGVAAAGARHDLAGWTQDRRARGSGARGRRLRRS